MDAVDLHGAIYLLKSRLVLRCIAELWETKVFCKLSLTMFLWPFFFMLQAWGLNELWLMQQANDRCMIKMQVSNFDLLCKLLKLSFQRMRNTVKMIPFVISVSAGMKSFLVHRVGSFVVETLVDSLGYKLKKWFLKNFLHPNILLSKQWIENRTEFPNV